MKKKEWKKCCKDFELEYKYWHSVCIREREERLRVQHIEDSKNIEELREAAEFEARVAAKLAKGSWDGILLHCTSTCPWHSIDPKDSIRCIHEYA